MLWYILIIFFAACGVYLSIASSKNIFFQLNAFHCEQLDIFFNQCTWLGDGVFSIIVFVILLLLQRLNLAVQVITGYLFSGILAQIAKHFLHAPRPHTIIASTEYHYFIEGVTHTGMSSFPSGHTTSIFALAVLMALNTPNKRMIPAFVIPAILTGYSRIYLGEHFLLDVTAGALLGTLSAVLVYWRLYNVKITWAAFNQRKEIQIQ
jgi:membrane-associated phospholipid phosphatase